MSAQPADSWAPRSTPAGAPYGSLDKSECKQQFSIAFAHAVATAARCSIARLESDFEGIDLTVRQVANHNVYTKAQVDIQLKCTAQDVLRTDGVHWPLRKPHYDALRDPRTFNKQILVVLLVPDNLDDWLTQTEDHAIMRRSAYWVNLQGAPSIQSDEKTVVLPRTNRFNAEQLLDILGRIGNGGAP